MENIDQHIENFIKHVKSRLNKHFGLTVLISSLAAGGIIMTVIALSYILRGYHVPPFWYPVCFVSSLLLGGCVWLYFRKSHDQAARFTDKFFSLKDTVRSYSGFHKAKKSSGFYKLQAIQTESSISSISINKIRYKCPFCILAIAIVLILTSGLMGFKNDSPAVRERMEREKLMLESTQLINKQIDELMEQMQEELEEKDLDKIIDMNEVRQKADELKETPDIKEAMRQYAQLERELGEVLSKLTQRQDEQLLERMGKQLKKDDNTKALGNQLTQKEYDSASKEMEKFKIDPDAKMEIQKEQIEKLKEMAARMAQEIEKNGAAASQQSSQGQTQNSQQGNQNQQNNSRRNQQSTGNRLAQMTQQLNQSAQALSQSMQQAMRNQMQNGQPQSQNNQQTTGQMRQMMQGANQDLGNMGQFLQQLDAKRQAQAMMQNMLNSLTQSQAGLGQMPNAGQMPGEGQMPGSCNMPGQNGQNGQDGGGGVGGLDAGTGSSLTRNTEPGKDAPAGEMTRLQGVHNNGTSTTALEESGSGSGSSLGTLEREPEEYMRQVESFIRREDVPESVKAGVKAYFENIHNVNEEN